MATLFSNYIELSRLSALWPALGRVFSARHLCVLVPVIRATAFDSLMALMLDSRMAMCTFSRNFQTLEGNVSFSDHSHTLRAI